MCSAAVFFVVCSDMRIRCRSICRGGADQPGELVFGLDLLRHQVEKPDPQGPDVLMRGAVGDMTMTPSFRSTSRRAGQGDGMVGSWNDGQELGGYRSGCKVRRGRWRGP
jgi:hypothetical protein